MFKDLEDIEIFLRQLLIEFKLDDKVGITWNNRYRSTFAAFCYKKHDFRYKTYIDISVKNMKANLWNVPFINECLRHEIAHAIDFYERGHSPHDKRWKEIAIQCGSTGIVFPGAKYFKIKEIKDKK